MNRRNYTKHFCDIVPYTEGIAASIFPPVPSQKELVGAYVKNAIEMIPLVFYSFPPSVLSTYRSWLMMQCDFK